MIRYYCGILMAFPPTDTKKKNLFVSKQWTKVPQIVKIWFSDILFCYQTLIPPNWTSHWPSPHSMTHPRTHSSFQWQTLNEFSHRVCTIITVWEQIMNTKGGGLHGPADLWSNEYTSTTCVQCYAWSLPRVNSNSSSEELWPLHFVSKYRKREVYIHMHSTVGENGFKLSGNILQRDEWAIVARSHVGHGGWKRGILWSVLLWLLRICSCIAVDVNFRADREKESGKP